MKKVYNHPALLIALCFCALLFCTNDVNNHDTAGTVSISGTVLDARNTASVSGVLVGIPGKDVSATTDAQGKFVLNNIPSEETFLYFRKDHYMPQLVHMDLSGTSGMIVDDSVLLFRAYAVVTGTLVNAVSNTPVNNAYITSRDTFDDAEYANDSAVTNASGSFILPFLIPDSLGRHFVAVAEGFAPFDFVRSLRSGDSVYVTGLCKPYLSVHGKCTESDSSTPLQGVKTVCGNDTVTSDNTGVFIFTRIIGSDTARVFRFFKESYDTVLLTDTITASGSIGTVILHKSTGTLQGTVVLQGRKTNSGAIVTLSLPGFRDTTDSAGRFQLLHVPVGSREISVINSDFSCSSCTTVVYANQTNSIDFRPVVLSGIIETRVDWRADTGDSVKFYPIADTLMIMPGGSLNLYPGVRVHMAANSHLIVSEQGAFTSFGERDRLVDISPAPGSSAANSIEFPAIKTYVPSLQFTKVTNTSIISQTGLSADHCLFISVHDTQNSPMINLVTSPGVSTFSNCDFIRIHSASSAAVLQGSGMTQGPVMKDCIFYMANNASLCNPFCVSESTANNIAISFTNCDFFATCTPAGGLFDAIVPDTANIFTLDPGYADVGNVSFFLKESSQVLDKSTTNDYLGALGKK